MQYSSSAMLDRSRGDGTGRDRQSPYQGKAGKGKRKGRKPKDPLWAKLLVVFGALLMLGSGGAIIGNRVLFAAATSSVTHADLGFGDPNTKSHVTINGAKNILLIGVDTRPGQNVAADPARSDSIMILHIPATHDRAFLVSIPRDTYVTIPAFNNGKSRSGEQHNKINAAFAFGGQGLDGLEARKQGTLLLKKTIENNFGVGFDAGAIVDFAGFQDVVSVLGGVDMYVDEKTTSIHIGFTKDGKEKVPFTQDANLRLHAVAGVTPKVYNVGQQHLAAWEALDYCRQRDLLANGDSDYGRQRHQQQFIKAVFKGILNGGVLSNPGKLTKVLDVVGKAMTVDDGNIGLEDWIFAMRGIGGSDVITVKTNGGKFNSQNVSGLGDVEIMDEASLQLMTSIRNDAVDGFIDQHPDWVSQS